MEITGRKMALIFTVPALIKVQGLVAMLITVECCALVRYQVGIMHVPMNIAVHIVYHCFFSSVGYQQ